MKATIGLPVYNGAATIAAAIDSLLAQTLADFELVICDNASTDGTYEICRGYAAKDPRVRVFRNEANLGAVRNFARCVELASAGYFMFAAADDRWHPEFLAETAKILDEDPRVGVAMSAVERTLPLGGRLDLVRFVGSDDPLQLSRLGVLWRLLSPKKFNLFIYGLFRTELLRKAMPYFPDALGGDRLFLCQFALGTRLAAVDRCLYFRAHQPDHEAKYQEACRKVAVWTRQIAALISVLARSPLIGKRYLAIIPFAAARYAAWVLWKAYMPKSLPMRMRKLALISAACAAPVAAGWWLGGPQGAAVGAGVLNLAALAALAWYFREKAVMILHAEERIAKAIPSIHREVRYAADLAIEGPLPPVEPSNPLSAYSHERREKHRKIVRFARMTEESRIKEVYLSQLFPGIDKVTLPIGMVHEMTGHVNHVDMLYVCAIAQHIKAKDIFEFGTYQGRTTYHLTYASPGARVTTLNLSPEADPRYGPHIGRYFKGTDREAFITQVFCDSTKFDTAARRQKHDFIFVDGDHEYDFVKNDTAKAFEMLKPGGAIVWHDYAPKKEGLVRFFRDFTQEKPLFRIKRTCLLVHVDGVDPMAFEPAPMQDSLEKQTLEADPYYIEELYHA